MEKNVAILGHSGAIRDSYRKTTPEIFAESGQNTGNLAFWHAIDQHVLGQKTYIGWHHSPQLINDRNTALLMVAANWIGPHSDLHHLAKMVEEVNVPVVIVGLGAQAGLNAAFSAVELKHGTIRFLEVCREKNVHIGARGLFSAELLEHYGLKNIEIMGCPSNFLNPLPHLGKLIEEKFKASNIRRVALNFDLDGAIVPIVKNFSNWLVQRGGAFLCQSPLDPLRLARNDFNSQIDRDYIHHVRAIVRPNDTFDEFLGFIYKYFQLYYDVEAWMGYLRTCDLSVGSRVHGNILALQVGTPAIIIPHDSRTRELIETLKLPYLPINEAKTVESPERLLSSVRFDGAAYDENRKQLAGAYTALLKLTASPISASLMRFLE